MNENLIAGLVIASIPFIYMVVTLVRLSIEIKNSPMKNCNEHSLSNAGRPTKQKNMKSIEHFIAKATDITINVKGESMKVLTKEEVIKFIRSVYGKTFTTRGSAMTTTNLSYLGSVNGSAKIMKGLKEMNYSTYILYLQSYKTAFGNVCAKGEHCADACLNTSGRVKMDVKEFRILGARYLKTVLFYVNRQFFNDWLFAEIDAHSKKYENFMVRLNGTSDLSPLMFTNVDGVNILQKFPDTTFYDYTKIKNRVNVAGNHSNYHLTFSFDGHNMYECRMMLALGINVSIVIDGEMPTMFMNKPVFSMDITDLRPLDEMKGAFGYLKLKETLNKDYDSSFVIKNLEEVNY